MISDVKSKWNDIIAYIDSQDFVSGPVFRTFIKPLEVYKEEGDTVILSVDKEKQNAVLGVIKNNYTSFIEVAIEEVLGKRYSVDFIYKQDITVQVDNSSDSSDRSSIIKAQYPFLSSGNSFDNFVASDNNLMAYSASLAVAESPTSQVYNPLFLYSSPGLGKTHLMHSIARHIIMNNPELKVLYVTGEDFTNQVVEAIRNNKEKDSTATANLRSKFRDVDVLLIDDIQYIIGKEATQVEFFNTFNYLSDQNKQIVISSDKPPKDMKELDNRYKSRFVSGLPIDIQPPSYETNIAILRNIQEKQSVKLEEFVLDYIAKNINDNIRDLIGAHNKMVFVVSHFKKDLTLSEVEEALSDIIVSNKSNEITVEYIVKVVADHYNISEEDIYSNKRTEYIARPRHIVMYLSGLLTDLSTTNIGKILGNKTHGTVINGRDKIRELIKTDEKLKNEIDIIIKKINPNNN